MELHPDSHGFRREGGRRVMWLHALSQSQGPARSSHGTDRVNEESARCTSETSPEPRTARQGRSRGRRAADGRRWGLRPGETGRAGTRVERTTRSGP